MSALIPYSVYRTFFDEDGDASFWYTLTDDDRVTGRKIIQADTDLLEIEHTERDRAWFGFGKVRTWKRLALYSPEMIRYEVAVAA